MKNIILASTSTLFGGQYLDYLKKEITVLFEGVSELIFIPYARPGGISEGEYTKVAAAFFGELGIEVKGLHEFDNPILALENAKAYFTGGGNTFLLVKTLHEKGLVQVLKDNVLSGKPYLGTSAGSNIGGVNMKTTNDMPIVYPSSFDCMALVGFNINPHYLDPDPNSKHNGETRETRIKEFHSQNDTPVVGIREGSWIRVLGDEVCCLGSQPTRIFEAGKAPYEVPSGTRLDF